MVLSLNDVGDAVKALQRDLNKLGSLLTIDGHYGPGTRTAVGDARSALARPGPATTADDALIAALDAALDPFVAVTAPGATFIARAEVTSATAYLATYRFPTWPSETSGITIGIGYDLQFVTPAQLRADWTGVLAEAALARLSALTQVVGSRPRLDAVRDIDVPLTGAMSVFARRSLPAYLTDVRRIYPQVDALSAPRQTALVSLVYNRGPRLTDKDPAAQDRREMRVIRDLLAANDLDAVAEQFDSMTRLWNPQKLAGLIQRRHDEATLWRTGFGGLDLV